MENEALKFCHNENLIRKTFEFVNIKELSELCQVSKLFKKSARHFNEYWRDACKKIFTSEVNHYNISNNASKYLKNFAFKESDTDFKEYLRIGFYIKNYWVNNNTYIENQEFLAVQNEIYSSLKEFYSLPKLRKENIYLENELNTILQTYLYDFVYDSQDLYDYYDDYFNLSYNSEVLVKNIDLPFSSFLLNLNDILYQIDSEKELKLNFGKLRWYCYEEVFNDKILENSFKKKKSMIYEENIFNSNSYEFTIKEIQKILEKNKNSSFFTLFLNLVFTFIYYCKLNYQIISAFFENEALFLNELIKRHKTFSDAAIHLNEYLENFNVAVNYLYEKLYPNYPNNPKFSILRLMLVIWNREVITALEEPRNFISNSTIKIAKCHIIKELNKVLEGNIITYTIKESPKSNELYLCDETNLMDKSTNHFDSGFNSKFNFGQTNNEFFIYDSDVNLNEYNYNDKEFFEKNDSLNYICEDNSEYFIEQAFSTVLDSSCNEFNVFHINSSKMTSNQYYENLEFKLVSFINEVLKSFKKKKQEIFDYFKNSELFRSKFINRTRYKIRETVFYNIQKFSKQDLLNHFEDFITKFSFSLNKNNIENFLKSYDQGLDTYQEQILHDLIVYSMNKFNDENTCKYLSLCFISENIKNKSPSWTLLIESNKWFNLEEDKKTFLDETVERETKRKNIPLSRKNENMLFSFTSNMNWSFVEYLHQQEMRNKISNNFAELETDEMDFGFSNNSFDDFELTIKKK